MYPSKRKLFSLDSSPSEQCAFVHSLPPNVQINNTVSVFRLGLWGNNISLPKKPKKSYARFIRRTLHVSK